MDAGIILGGQQPDILGAMDKGRAMAESQIGLNRQNALAELYRTQGAQIAAGDQNALNALAGFDPNASLGIQSNRLGLQAQQQEIEFSAEKMQMLRDESKREAAAALQAQAATLTAEQLAAESAALSEALSGGAFFYQNKDKAGYDAFLASKGLDPAEFPFEAFPAHAASVEGVLEAMKAFEPAGGPEWVAATPEQAAAYGAASGQINQTTGEFKKTGEGNGISYTTRNADGTETTVQIGGKGGKAGDMGLTEAEGKATGFLYRMENSDKILSELEAEGSSLWNKTAGQIPVLGNYMVSEGAQKFDQAKRDFINSILRRESGAVISPEEFANAEVQYFPQPGDGPEVVAQKRKNRLIAIEGVRASAGAGGGTTSGVDSGSQPGFDQAEIDALMNGP